MSRRDSMTDHPTVELYAEYYEIDGEFRIAVGQRAVTRIRFYGSGDFPHQPGPGVSQAAIDQLPSYQYAAEEAAARKEDAFTCSICLVAVEPGQKVRVLTCEHKFHAPCVDQWLLGNRTCPMCRSVVQG